MGGHCGVIGVKCSEREVEHSFNSEKFYFHSCIRLLGAMFNCREFYFVLGAFEELRKATISFVMSVCLSVRTNGTARLPLFGSS
jgi:hypothetical protein